MTEHQREALRTATQKRLGILCGSPGTGKTFATAALVKQIIANGQRARVCIAAPTGKAAVRCTEAMRKFGIDMKATTIHQLLEVNGNTHSGEFKFQRNASNPLDFTFIIIDETSMLDTNIAASLFCAMPVGAHALLIGDDGQLPPVGHGAPLRDLIAAGVPCGELSEIKRNAGMIVKACQEIKDGKKFNVSARPDESKGVNLIHIQADTADEQLQTIVGLVGAVGHQGFNPIWDVQVLVATNEKTAVSRRPLNAVLQGLLNPQDDAVPADARNAAFRPGDKIICLKNSEMSVFQLNEGSAEEDTDSYRKTQSLCYVANGDMGRVLAVDKNAAVVQFLLPDRVVRIVTARKRKKEDADGTGQGGDQDAGGKAEVDLAYAKTIHKSQGSEYPVVIVVIDENAGPLGCRESIYTAISRASRLCFLVGKMSTAWRFAQRVTLGRRKTFLVQELAGSGQDAKVRN